MSDDADDRARINARWAGKIAADRDHYRKALEEIASSPNPEAGWRIAQQALGLVRSGLSSKPGPFLDHGLWYVETKGDLSPGFTTRERAAEWALNQTGT